MVRIRRLTAQNFKQLREVELVFPRRGRFLVQGANESGKSTLFEAVYFGLFGRPLVTETAALRLDDVIHYGADAAWVALELELPGDRVLAITRHVRRGKANQWALTIAGADGSVEELRNNAGVNERVEAELGFDGEALLNTCFVEQKKLEKLEGLAKKDREQSLKRLLNLDRLVVLEDDLKVRPEERANVARLRQRLDLAEHRARLPVLQRELDEVLAALGRHEVHAGLGEVLAGLAVVATLAERLAAARSAEAALAERLAETERAGVGLARVAEARTAHERAHEAAVERIRLAEALALAEAARDERLPAVVARGKALGRLKRRLACVAHFREERTTANEKLVTIDDRLARAAEEREALNGVRQALVAARAAQRDAGAEAEVLAGDAKAFAVRRALVDWVAAEHAIAASADPGPQLAEATARQAALGGRARTQLLAVAAGGAAVLALVRWLLPAPAQILWWVAILAWLLLLAWLGVRAARRDRELAEELGRLRGEASVHEHKQAALAVRAAEAAERLRALNAVQPADAARAQRAVDELDARLAGRSEAEVGEALDGARHAAIEATMRGKDLEAREAALREAGRFDAAALGTDRDRLAGRVARLDAFLACRAPAASELARTLGMSDDEIGHIDGELGELRVELKSLRAEAEQAPNLAAAVTARAATEMAHRAAAALAWGHLPELPGRDPWPEHPEEADFATTEAALSKAYADAGGDAVRREAEAAARMSAQLKGEHGAAERAAAGRYAALLTRAERLDLHLDLGHDVQADAVAAAAALLSAELVGEPPTLARQRDALAGDLNVTRHEIGRLEGQLGLAGEALDPATEQAAWREAETTMAVRERAATIVAQAGRNVVQRVMPSTIEHMRRLLPALTDGRYFDADLTEDHRIKVLDERAGDWKQKNIFSGGTKDQFSLALRLAFALATLPEERGSAPSFLFLDEPLGAFDDNRARALVDLLTTGEVADSFDQIFLISHVRVEEALFDYQITLVDGRVVDSNLPAAQRAAATGASPGEQLALRPA
jgi:hypothetical protein